MRETLVDSCDAVAKARRRVADIHVPFYKTLAAIETIKPGCVPNGTRLPTPLSMCHLYQHFADGSPWKYLTDDERTHAWSRATCTKSAVQSALFPCNPTGFRARAIRERWPLDNVVAPALSDDGRHPSQA
ncbi:hypothetical protein pneo_cds_706 [Pandoravirus neocaledonia]|uniref:DUF5848 domain-containing protein n=1 Tax=Pandoravirus neocaledonia TaxID=2107708 RepID=A0A2U7UCZ9_9VIRU|nr:hypothetical protein pneo_cds_706 [Pandoravirus neocaledonia]AVK76313.1 hypothetical protein pneo_cds_706 [Pandoravirus neocaledonia]